MQQGLSISIGIRIDRNTGPLGGGDTTDDLLLEDGSFLLLEDGGKILLEN